MFDDDGDYAAFVRVLGETCERFPAVAVVTFCLMPNHWHLVLWPAGDGALSEFMRVLTVTHTQRWHAHRRSAGQGPVYQGRFKSFPIEADGHLLTVGRYVERNAVRANLAERAAAWPWGGAAARGGGTVGAGMVAAAGAVAGRGAGGLAGLGGPGGDGGGAGGGADQRPPGAAVRVGGLAAGDGRTAGADREPALDRTATGSGKRRHETLLMSPARTADAGHC